MEITLFNGEKTFNDHFSFLDLNSCDSLSKLKGYDLQELIKELLLTKLVFRESLGLDQNLTFGIEIEYEDVSKKHIETELSKIVTIKNDDKNSWCSKTDCTVHTAPDFGGEITTPILTDTKENWKEVSDVFQMLKRCNAVTNNKAGQHIHFGTNILDKKISYYMNLFKLWTIMENIVYRFVYGDKLGPRKNILYAVPISNCLFPYLYKLEKAKNLAELRGTLSEVGVRGSSAINFNNIKDDDIIFKNTLEFRCPNGTTNEIIAQNNTNFFGNILTYCKNSSFDYDYVESELREFNIENSNLEMYNEIYLQKSLKLVDLIFKNNLDKLYFLKQYLKGFENMYFVNDNIKQIRL